MYIQPRANAIIAKGQSIIDTSTGEVINEQLLIGRRKYVDKSQFAKLYASEIGLLYELSKSAQKVFMCLIKYMDYNNKAIFKWKEIYKNYGTAYKGLKELIENNIIAPTDIQNMYWMNPTIVCKGERFAKYTEFVIGTDPEKIASNQSKKTLSKLPKSVVNKMSYAANKPDAKD